MNFLAHIYLSGNYGPLMVGNFIADSVKGSEVEKFPEEVRKGIYLHRKIDTFTDTHPIFCTSKNRLRATQGKFSGVVADIFYDHFLAVNWSMYSQIPLDEFASGFYLLMHEHVEILPPLIKIILPRMIQKNWLVNYSNFYGIERSLYGMSERTKYPSNMKNAIEDLHKDYLLYEEEFKAFFEDIRNYTRDILENNI